MEYKDDKESTVVIVWRCQSDYSHGVSGIFRGRDEEHALALVKSKFERRDSPSRRGSPSFLDYHFDDFERFVCQGDLLWSKRRPYYDMISFYDVYRFKIPITVEKYASRGNIPTLKYLASHKAALENLVPEEPLPDNDAHHYLTSLASEIRAPMFVAYWQDAVKKIIDSACVIGLFLSLDSAKLACENVNSLRATYREKVSAGEDPEEIIDTFADHMGSKTLTDQLEPLPGGLPGRHEAGWSYDYPFHWMPSHSATYSMIFVVQEIPNPYVFSEEACQDLELGYHCGKHPR